MVHKIVFLDRDTIAPHIDIRRPSFKHEWTEYDRTKAEDVKERLKDATIAITNKAPIRKATLEKCQNLKMIAIAATGSDIVDVEACNKRGIIVSNIRGYAVNTVPEHTFALILSLKRALVGYRQDGAAGDWRKAAQFCFFNHRIDDLRGSILGIIGEGSLGSSVAAIGFNGFGMKPVFLDHDFVKDEDRRAKTFMPHKEFMSTADIVSVHCPLTPQTENLLNLETFRSMKNSAIVINTARGAVINEADLCKAIKEEMIAGAAIDVLATEPPANNHPYLQLLSRPNFILTPHIAWASTEAMQTLSDQMIENIENFVDEKPSNIVS